MGDDPQTNPAVIVARLNRLENDMNDYGATLSNTREQANRLEREKLSRSEFEHWTEDATAWRETVVIHMTRLDERVGRWAAGNAAVAVLSGVIAAIVGRAP